MKSFTHEQTDVTIIHNSSKTGDATLVLPLDGLEIENGKSVTTPGKRYLRVSGVPCEALAAFGRAAALSDAVEAIENLDA